MKKRRRRLFYRLIVLVPASFLALLLALAAVSVYRVNAVRSESVVAELADYLAVKQGRPFPFPDEYQGLDPRHRNVFVLGASSVVVSDGAAFDRHLEARLTEHNSGIRVLNLGVNGIDSFSVRGRVVEALISAKAAPALIILYLGHNDYTNAYQLVITPRYYRAFDVPFRLAHACWRLAPGKSMDYFWYSRVAAPKVLKFLQAAKLVRFDGLDYGAADELILASFRGNVERIIATAGEEGVPLLFITPVGNLHAAPYGDFKRVSQEYEMGISAEHGEEAVRHLVAARDAEVFTPSIRAKSRLNAYLRTVSRPGVEVLDLESRVLAAECGSDESLFLDYFHFSEEGHQLVADSLLQHILGSEALRKALGVSNDE